MPLDDAMTEAAAALLLPVANTEAGEILIEVGGRPFIVRPDADMVFRIEKAVGALLRFALRLAENETSLTELVLVTAIILDPTKVKTAPKKEELVRIVFDAGLPNLVKPINDVLEKILNPRGHQAPADPPAPPST